MVLILTRQISSSDGDTDNDYDGDEVVRDLIVAKHRNGPIGVVPLVFIRNLTRFENYINENICE
jgi:replicative DNA helicase